MDMATRGWTTISVSVSPPCKQFPKGGTYQRLERLLLYKKETWDEVIIRLLDHYEATHKETP